MLGCLSVSQEACTVFQGLFHLSDCLTFYEVLASVTVSIPRRLSALLFLLVISRAARDHYTFTGLTGSRWLASEEPSAHSISVPSFAMLYVL